MLAKVSRKALLEALAKMAGVIPKKHTLPIITNVSIEAKGEKITLTGTNLEVGVIAACRAEVEKAGSFCVSLVLLQGFLKLVKTDDLLLKVVKGELIIESGNYKTKLTIYSITDFPPVIEQPKSKLVRVVGLTKALYQVDYAMAKDDSRPVLAGVNMVQRGRGIELAAADGFRLAVTHLEASGKLPQSVVIPRKAVETLQKLNVIVADIRLHYREDTPTMLHITSDNGDTVIITQLVQGTFPDYPQLIPKNRTVMSVDKKELQDAVKTVSVNSVSGIVRLKCKKMALLVEGKGEEATTSLTLQASGSIKKAFNYKYLLDTLTRMPDLLTMASQPSPGSPVVLKNNGSTHVIMPMHVEW